MNQYMATIMQLLTDKGFGYQQNKRSKFLRCSARDAYGVVFHTFIALAEAVEITSVHSRYVADSFLVEAAEILHDTNRGIHWGQFYLNRTKHIAFYALYRPSEISDLYIGDLCENVLQTGSNCRQAIFENMLCEIE